MVKKSKPSCQYFLKKKYKLMILKGFKVQSENIFF
jgi:hypothetical protein